MYTLAQIEAILNKSSYVRSQFAKGEIFLDASNKAIRNRLFILHKAVEFEKYRVGVAEYNSLAVALSTLLEVFDYLLPVPSLVAGFYPIGGNSSILYVTGINDSTIASDSTWSSTKINSLLVDSDVRKTKIPITAAGNKTITWQTDIAPESTLTYAAKHGNRGITRQGYYTDGAVDRDYNPSMIVTYTGALITTIQFTEVFPGYIIIT